MKTTTVAKSFIIISLSAFCLQANAADLYVADYGGDILESDVLIVPALGLGGGGKYRGGQLAGLFKPGR